MSKLKTPFEIVVMAEASKKFDTSMWENLAGQARRITELSIWSVGTSLVRDEFEEFLSEGERKYMEEYHGDKLDMWIGKGKNVRLNKRKYLPASYRTAKSVACNCLEYGVMMHDNEGNVLAKSKCEAAYKEPKQSSNTLETPLLVQAINAVSKLDGIAALLDEDERAIIQDKLDGRYSSS